MSFLRKSDEIKHFMSIPRRNVYFLSFSDHHTDLLVKDINAQLDLLKKDYIHVNFHNQTLKQAFNLINNTNHHTTHDALYGFFNNSDFNKVIVFSNLSKSKSNIQPSFIKELHTILQVKHIIIDSAEFFAKNYDYLQHYITPILIRETDLYYREYFN